MSNHLFTADLHLGHKFVSDLRGYDSTDDHDTVIISNLRSTVRKDDVLWVLGDYSVSQHERARKLLADVPGRKILVPGNHDPEHPMHRGAWKHQREAMETFEAVIPYQRLKLSGINFLLSHLPYGTSKVSRITPGPEWRETDAAGYFANQDGQIRGRYGRVLKPWIAGRGYEYIAVPTGATTKKNRTVHSLVCAAFHGERPDGMVVAHGDGNPLNNRASNLRWATPKENQSDRADHGTLYGRVGGVSGESHPNSKLTWLDVSFIRESTETNAALAWQFNVGSSTISSVRTGDTWNPKSAEVINAGDHKDVDRYSEYRLTNWGLPLLCGHVHEAWKFQGNQFNVGVDVNDFKPVSVNTVLEWWKGKND